MDVSIIGYITIAIIATISGSLPFGPVNLSVVNITINKSVAKAMEFSLASAIVEVLIAVSAIYFGQYIEQFFNTNSWIQVLIFSVFIFLGVFNLIRKTHPKLSDRSKLKVNEFFKGIFISAINPQVIIFWIFALTFITQEFQPSFTYSNLVVFLVGVFITKLGVLFMFSKLSLFLKSRLTKSCTLINRTMGTVLLIIGLVQAYKFFILST